MVVLKFIISMRKKRVQNTLFFMQMEQNVSLFVLCCKIIEAGCTVGSTNSFHFLRLETLLSHALYDVGYSAADLW